MEPVPHDPFLERIEMQCAEQRARRNRKILCNSLLSISIVRMLADYSMAELLIRIVHKRLDCTLRISSSRRRLAGAQIAAIFLLQFRLRSLSFSAFRFFSFFGVMRVENDFLFNQANNFHIFMLSTVNCACHRAEELFHAAAD